jgi:hypothetical protein
MENHAHEDKVLGCFEGVRHERQIVEEGERMSTKRIRCTRICMHGRKLGEGFCGENPCPLFGVRVTCFMSRSSTVGRLVDLVRSIIYDFPFSLTSCLVTRRMRHQYYPLTFRTHSVADPILQRTRLLVISERANCYLQYALATCSSVFST